MQCDQSVVSLVYIYSEVLYINTTNTVLQQHTSLTDMEIVFVDSQCCVEPKSLKREREYKGNFVLCQEESTGRKLSLEK